MRPSALLFIQCVLIAVLTATSAEAGPPTVLYRLHGEHAFQEGCFGQCDCPIRMGELEGTFGLTPTAADGEFLTWTVDAIDWQVPGWGLNITGSGLFRLRPGIDAMQQLILDLSIDGGPVERHDSGIVPAEMPFPGIDVQVSLHDLQCWDRLFLIEASPAPGPIAFRFKATVTSVFDGLGALRDLVAPGAVIRGRYVFDSRTPNSAPPVELGEAGLYHHERPPAGVRTRVAGFRFQSVPAHPDFDVIVNNDVGSAALDEYGFAGRDNRAWGLLTAAAVVDKLDIDWLVSAPEGVNVFDGVELPLNPPDLALLGGGLLTIYGECTRCLAPAAFFRIEATLTSLAKPACLWVRPDLIWWEGPEDAWGYDVLRGDLESLRVDGGFASATRECLADDHEGTVLDHVGVPDPGRGFWFLVRPVGDAVVGNGTWDSFGLTQVGIRDEALDGSGAGCP